MRSIKRLAEGTGETFYYLGNILYESYSVDATGIESSLPQKEYVQQAMDIPLVLFQDVDENPTTGTLDGREAYFYHTNPRGDVYALSNEAGDIVERYDYSLYGEVQVLDPFHNPVAGNVSQIGNPFLFGAVYFDNETKFYWMRFRYYDPALRGFLLRDIAADDSLGNLYAPFENNVGSFRDPSGLGPRKDYQPGYFIKTVVAVGGVVDGILSNWKEIAASPITEPARISRDLVYSLADMNDEKLKRMGLPGYQSYFIGNMEKRISAGYSGKETAAYAIRDGAIIYTIFGLASKLVGKTVGKLIKECPDTKIALSKAFASKSFKSPSKGFYMRGKPSTDKGLGVYDPEFVSKNITERINLAFEEMEQAFKPGYVKKIRELFDSTRRNSTSELGVYGETTFNKKGIPFIKLNKSIGNAKMMALTILHEVRHFRHAMKPKVGWRKFLAMRTDIAERVATSTDISQAKKLGLTKWEIQERIDAWEIHRTRFYTGN